MRLKLTAAIVLACALTLLPASAGSGAPITAPVTVPAGFWGVAPQTEVSEEDARYMVAGGVESVRVPVPWDAIQPTRKGGYDWSSLDKVMEVTSRAGLRVLPFLYGTPPWLGQSTTLPVNNGRQRAAWTAFLQAAVKRYGPGGEFWAAHATEGIDYEPAIATPLPIRTWQIWNEANFFYFAYPVSPRLYAQLINISAPAIKRVDPAAKVVLTGLFGRPTAGGAKGMPAAEFLRQVYRYPGIKSRFDAVAIHPYAVDTETLEEIVEEVDAVTLEAHDRPGLYVTEMGWGSQNDFNQVAFEQGIQGQVRELRGAYGYLLENQRRLNLKGVYWFSWKDAPGLCNFCDSVGLFRAGRKFHPKPAWRTFVSLTGGRARP
jgi:Beta-galactosidase